MNRRTESTDEGDFDPDSSENRRSSINEDSEIDSKKKKLGVHRRNIQTVCNRPLDCIDRQYLARSKQIQNSTQQLLTLVNKKRSVLLVLQMFAQFLEVQYYLKILIFAGEKGGEPENSGWRYTKARNYEAGICW